MHREDGQQFDIVEACDIIFGDLSDHVKYRVLKFYNPSDRLKDIEKNLKQVAREEKYKSNEAIQAEKEKLKQDEGYKQRVAWFVRNAKKNMKKVMEARKLAEEQERAEPNLKQNENNDNVQIILKKDKPQTQDLNKSNNLSRSVNQTQISALNDTDSHGHGD